MFKTPNSDQIIIQVTCFERMKQIVGAILGEVSASINLTFLVEAEGVSYKFQTVLCDFGKS